MTEKKPTLEYARTPRRWRWWDTLLLLAILALVALLVSFRYLPRGIYDIRVGLTRH